MAGEASAAGQSGGTTQADVEGAQTKATQEMRDMMIASIKFNSDVTAAQIAGNNGQRAAKAYPQG